MNGSDRAMLSFCLLSVLLLLGKLLRSRIRFLQKLFLPSSIIAGFLGLAAGPSALGWLPAWVIEQWSALPGILISIVFASLFMGMKVPMPKTLWSLGGSQLCFGAVFGLGQYLVALVFVGLVLQPLFGTPAIFACILEVGFSGGHGSAAGMAPVFAELGLPAGGALAQMSATIGLLTAVIVGVALVNWSARHGYCSELGGAAEDQSRSSSGLIIPSERYPIASATVAPEAIEPLVFHISFVGLAVLLGYGLLQPLRYLHPILESFPLFPLAMIGGLIVQVMATPLGVSNYFDRGTFDRILGVALDVLVVTAIATLRLDLFAQNLLPFTLLMLVGIAWATFTVRVLAPRMFPQDWFERGITEFGMQTGVTAMGLLLLRLVDPQYHTDTAKAFGFKQIIYEPFLGGGFVTALSPFIVASLGLWPSAGVCLAGMIGFWALGAVNGWARLGRVRLQRKEVGSA